MTKAPPLSQRERFAILERDGFRCRYCGATAQDCRLHVDHVLARSRGGTNAPANLVTACEDCNLGKSAKLLDEPPADGFERIFATVFYEEALYRFGGVVDFSTVFWWVSEDPDLAGLRQAVMAAANWDDAREIGDVRQGMPTREEWAALYARWPNYPDPPDEGVLH